MDYDNERDRTKYGYDAGNIVDGDVAFDPQRNEYVLVDEDGIAFSTQDLLKSLQGKRVRITCISFEAIEEIQKLMNEQKPDSN